MLWSDLAKRLSNTTRTAETYEEYRKSSKSQQDDTKDVGGFVGGTLKGGRRKTEAVVWRQLITLDADFIKGDFWTSVEMMFDFACAIYSTHSHSPENPRIRLVIPLNRPITPDEYQAISRRDRKSTRLNSSHVAISYAVFCLQKKKNKTTTTVITIKQQNSHQPR